MRKVKALKIGDSIGIFSPSEPIVESRVDRFERGIENLKSKGFKIELATNCMNKSSYMAGSIEERISDINELLLNKDVGALLSSWGGKSCNQLVNKLDYDLIKKTSKPILGFSDPCVLLNNITAKTGLVTFYGPNVVGKLHETEHSDFAILQEKNFSENLLGKVEKNDSKVIKSGISTGRLIGGNLSTFVLGVVCSDIPTDFFNDAILFWEDAGNSAQIINQHLFALENIGVLERLSGMIIGDFRYEDSLDWKKIDDFDSLSIVLGKYNYPILYARTFGHADIENPILPIGATCELDTNSKALKLKGEILI